MNAQSEMSPILPRRQIVPSSSVSRPQIFVTDLIVVDSLSRPEATKRLHLKLHRGLNILWARPSSDSDEEGNMLHGHSAGKTLFCRLLRHLLDEPRFGNELVEGQIRDKLKEGWVAGRVEIDGKAWLVGRSFASHHERFAARNLTVDEFFAGAISPGDLPPWLPYQEALQRATIADLPRHDFPGQLGEIEWLDLLPWLTRDQECRMAGISHWRATVSESKSPGSDVGERQFLMRLTLGLLLSDESKEYDQTEKYNRSRLATERRMPVLKDRADRDFASLRALLPEIGYGIGEELFVEAARQKLAEKLREIEEEPELSPTAGDISAAEKTLRDAVAARAAGEERVRTSEKRLSELGKSVGEWNEKKLQALNDEAQSRFRPTASYCGAPIKEAEGCELAKKYRTLSFAAMSLSGAYAAEEEKARKETQAVEAEHAKLAAELGTLSKAEKAAEEALKTMRAIRDRNFKFKERRRAKFEAGQTTLAQAATALKQLNTARTAMARLKKAIEGSLRRQKRTRRDVEPDRVEFSRLFGLMVESVLGKEVSGRVEFAGRDLVLHADQSGERTSTAIESIKVVCFDLAALVWGIEGRGWHPRFLVHDSPREADMDAAIYRRFFLIARRLEKLAYPNGEVPFQYIITTTEAPPASMTTSDWLICEPLDASIPSKRLLKMNL